MKKLTALLERISSQPLRTEAYRIAVIVLAHRVQTARVRDAGICGGLRAANVRISLESRQALALRLMVLWITIRIRAAIGLQARVDALPVQPVTVLGRCTVLVVLAHVSAFFF